MKQPAYLIDFHSHILPGADHGSSGIHETTNQMRMIQEYGVDTIVATPHFYPDRHRIDSFVTMTEHAIAEIRQVGLPFVSRLCLGAEVLYCDNIDRMEGLDRLCIRGTNILLLELPMDHWGQDVFETVEMLLKRYTVVLAHIDRYVRLQPQKIMTLLNMGAWAQVNASSLFSFGSHRRLDPFLAGERVVALGSDLHGADEKTYIKFVSASKKIGVLHEKIMARSADLLRSAENFI